MKHEELLKQIGELPLDGVTVRYDGSPLETISTMSDLKQLAADYRRAIEKLAQVEVYAEEMYETKGAKSCKAIADSVAEFLKSIGEDE